MLCITGYLYNVYDFHVYGWLLLSTASEGWGKVMFSVCSHLGGGGTYLGWGGTYLDQGSTYLGQGSTYLGQGVPILAGGYLPWPGVGIPHDGGTPIQGWGTHCQVRMGDIP